MTGKRMRKNPHGWMLAAVLLLVAAGLLAVHSHQTAAVPPEEPAQEEPSVTVIPAEPELPEEPVEEEPVPEKPWGPMAESAPVDDSYFDDVAFVGDSRTDGFRLYSGLNRGTYFCVTGETVASATELENWKGENGKKVSLAEAVAAADCGKIYLMLGVNELGWKGTDIFRGKRLRLCRCGGGPHRRGRLSAGGVELRWRSSESGGVPTLAELSPDAQRSGGSTGRICVRADGIGRSQPCTCADGIGAAVNARS